MNVQHASASASNLNNTARYKYDFDRENAGLRA
jgi:hypothetical protein